MKKRYGGFITSSLIVVIILVLLISRSVEMYQDKQANFKAEMVKEVKKNDKMIKDFIKVRDHYHKIKSVELDYESIRHNPMGGIGIDGYVNGDKSLYYHVTLSKFYVADEDYAEDKEEYSTSGGVSVKLDDYLNEEEDDGK